VWRRTDVTNTWRALPVLFAVARSLHSTMLVHLGQVFEAWASCDRDFIYLRQRRRYAIARDVCLTVCLSVSKITQKRVHGFGWNFACRQSVGTRTNWSTFEPDPDHSPDAGTGKSESRRSVEVGQTSTSFRGGYRLRDALQRDTVSPHCSPIKGQGVSRVRSTFLYNVRMRSYEESNLPNFRILAFVGGTCAPLSALLVPDFYAVRGLNASFLPRGAMQARP